MGNGSRDIENMGNVSRDMETLRNNKKEILEIISTVK